MNMLKITFNLEPIFFPLVLYINYKGKVKKNSKKMFLGRNNLILFALDSVIQARSFDCSLCTKPKEKISDLN